MLLGDGGAHGLQAFDVQVDGAAADGAPAGHGYPGDAGARDQRPEHQGAGPHGLHNLILCDRVREHGTVN